jgi:hypothetical protein
MADSRTVSSFQNYNYLSSTEANANEAISSPISIDGQVASPTYIRTDSKGNVAIVMPVRYF